MAENIVMQNGIAYKEADDGLFYPMLELTPPKREIGKYGQMRRQYLMENREPEYMTMLLEETLFPHLLEVDDQAHQMLDDIMKKMKQQEGVTEQMKADDQMKWVRMMNSIQNRAEEIVLEDLVYV